jgi:membrane protease subunit HflC
MYAKAIQSTGEFFEFVRTLELYEKSLDKNSTLYLSTDNELLHLLEGSSLPSAAASTTTPAAPAKSP